VEITAEIRDVTGISTERLGKMANAESALERAAAWISYYRNLWADQVYRAVMVEVAQ
jgi:hypothetical protein